MLRHLALPLVLLGALLAPASAHAGVVRAEGVLPPGQSGYVSIPGVASGTGSPHLTDQTGLFTDFRRKPFTFNQPGRTEQARADVKIVRDAFGVPAVTAQSEEGVWFGAGYAIAQDRLFQLELFRRATTGRLAEILGASYLDDDLIARRDYYTADERREMLDRLPPAMRGRIAAYRDGINAWIAHVRTNPQDLPGEFPAVGADLRDWTEDDSVAVGIFLARTVPSGSGVELENLRSLRAMTPAAFDTLLPLRTPGRVPTIPPAEGEFPSQPGRTEAQEREALRRTADVSKAWALPSEEATAGARANVAPGLVGQLGGSYMFVAKRDDGHAFLFNGPQLGYSIPELFVELELHGPGIDVRGVTAAGVPLIGIGHNGKVAWGFTSGLSDEDDLYAEQVVAGQPERYRFQGEERQMECRDEVFQFRSPPTDLLDLPDGAVPGAGSRTERICRTVHGPVETRADGTAYARRYAIWGRELETIEGIAQLNAAQSIQDVDAAMQKVTWNENVMAADSAGNIGFWHPGLHPLRPTGYDERLPYPGTGEAEWRGLMDRRKTPHVINPEQGWLANWNNVPSAGWTAGDSEASERNSGRFHRGTLLSFLVRDLKQAPTWRGAERVVEIAGTHAQQRPIADRRLRLARFGSKPKKNGRRTHQPAQEGSNAAKVLDALLAWGGSYHDARRDRTVDPGVAIWETFKDRARRYAVRRLGVAFDASTHLSGKTGLSHEFDITNGEAYALRTLTPRGYRVAAADTFAILAKRFDTTDISRWRESRRMYKVTAQGAAKAPELPFFDRGTWEQLVEVGPG